MLHERHAAMVTGTNGNAVRIQQCADVMRVPAFDIEGDDGNLLGRLADDGQALNGLEALGRRGEQAARARARRTGWA